MKEEAMPENKRVEAGRSQIDGERFTRESLAQWFDYTIAWLRILRDVRNVTPDFRNAVIDALHRFRYTTSHAVLAERWLELGAWQKYRAAGVLMVTDFLPNREQLESIGELDVVINAAARKAVSRIARRDFIHRVRVAEMLCEVKIETRRRVEKELSMNNYKIWMMLQQHSEQINALNSLKTKKLSWAYHPKFKKKLPNRSR